MKRRSPAPILASPEGKVLKGKLWTETVKDVSKVDPKLANFLN